MVSIISENIESIRHLFKKHQVVEAFLFGSAARDELKDNSDIDILLTFSEDISLYDYADNYFELKDALESLLKRKVDLVTAKSLKNPVLKENINETKKHLYAA